MRPTYLRSVEPEPRRWAAWWGLRYRLHLLFCGVCWDHRLLCQDGWWLRSRAKP